LISILMTSLLFSDDAAAQDKSSYMRIASIVVDAAKLESFKAALKEGVETAVAKEPGVHSFSAVYDKEDPTHITVFEVYASVEAYKLHIQTDHFKKYKATVEGMVKSLVLTDVVPIAQAAKP